MIAEHTGTVAKRGDWVTIAKKDGVFEVADINSLMQTEHLKSTDGQGRIARNVPWSALKFPNKSYHESRSVTGSCRPLLRA